MLKKVSSLFDGCLDGLLDVLFGDGSSVTFMGEVIWK